MADDTNQFGFREISNRSLQASDIPAAGAEYWGAIDRFALTFDGYAARPKDCGDFANASFEQFKRDGELPLSVSGLRTCLFFEQRRWRHLEEFPDAGSLRYIHALLEGIRARVAGVDVA